LLVENGVFLGVEAVVVFGSHDLTLPVCGGPSGRINGGLLDGSGDVPVAVFVFAGEGFQCFGCVERAVVACFLGGLDRFFGEVFFSEAFAFDGFGSSFVELVGLDDDGSVVLFCDGNGAFLRFVAGTLAVFRGAWGFGQDAEFLPLPGVDGFPDDSIVFFKSGGETRDEEEISELFQIAGGDEFAVGDIDEFIYLLF
jgi:hypothetical protein